MQNVLTSANIAKLITSQAKTLSKRLQAHRLSLFPPSAQKPLRPFGAAETARLLGIRTGYLKNLALDGKGPSPQSNATGRRIYTAEQILELRMYLDRQERSGRRYLPRRTGTEFTQIIPVVNFKGGSCKTTTTAHVAQYLALTGHRVLAMDFDPQGSLSALFGVQPEFDLGPNDSIYAALRYDDDARPLAEIIRPTNFPGLHLAPANIHLSEFEYDTPRLLTSGMDRASTIFVTRLETILAPVADRYDVILIDCPPQLGYITMVALCSATSVLITVHPQMLDVMSMCQFLQMLGGLVTQFANRGVEMNYNWIRYLITRYEPADGPQTQMVEFIRSMFGDYVLRTPMLKSVAISDAGITKQTLWEVDRRLFTPATYDRAMECLYELSGEIEDLIHQAWGRGAGSLEHPEELAAISAA
jgi:chromosome partitioning protein